jgi:hypothetical protein
MAVTSNDIVHFLLFREDVKPLVGKEMRMNPKPLAVAGLTVTLSLAGISLASLKDLNGSPLNEALAQVQAAGPLGSHCDGITAFESCVA